MSKPWLPRLPLIDVPNLAQSSREELAVVASDLNSVYMTLDAQVAKFITFTDPHSPARQGLWVEGLATAKSVMKVLKPVAAAVLQNLSTGVIQAHVFPAPRYTRTEPITFEKLREQLRYSILYLAKKMNTWSGLLIQYGIKEGNGMSRRPLSEILFHSQLLTDEPMDATVQDWEAVLHGLPTLEQRTPNYPAIWEGRLTRSQHLLGLGMNLEDRTVRPGNVNTLTGGRGVSFSWITGSTLIKWGKGLGSLKVLGSAGDFAACMVSRREAEDQQYHLNFIVNFFEEEYNREFKQGTRSEILRIIQRRNAAGEWNDPRLDTIGWTEADTQLLPNSRPAYKELKLRIPRLRREALTRVNDKFWNMLSPVLRQVYQTRFIAQTFQGDTLAYKRKCPVCTSVYPFQTLDLEARQVRLPQNWQNVAELDPNKGAAAMKGCCAEAQVAVAFVAACGRERQVAREIRTFLEGRARDEARRAAARAAAQR